MAYNSNDQIRYDKIKEIYDAKVAYNNATTDAERQKQNTIATNARKTLEAYGYKDIADQLSATGADATQARKILEQYAPKKATTTATPTVKATTAPDSTTLTNNELITTNNNEVRNKNNQLYDTQTNDRNVMANKYDKLEETAYSNPFESDEAKAILGKYDLAALYGRNNAVASGGASNGGNIDSYASANAMRQQASLINQGQMAVLDSHNNKINNVKGILADLGVYLQNQDKGMQTTIGLQANEGQRLFENEETAKNNETARLSEQASVTGYTPTEWTIKNDATYSHFLNPDGTFKKEMENVDIQALINNTTDADTKKKLAVIRAKKMLGNYGKYGQYINQGDVAFMDGNQITEARRESEQNDATVRESLKTEVNVANANNQNEINKIKATTEGEKELLEKQYELNGGNGSQVLEDDAQKVAKIIKDKINKLAKEKYGVEVIEDKGRGQYGFNLPEGHETGWWDDIVIKEILESTLTDTERLTLLNQLGFIDHLNDFSTKYKELSDGTYVAKTEEEKRQAEEQQNPQPKSTNITEDDLISLPDAQRAFVEYYLKQGRYEDAQYVIDTYKNSKIPF